MSRGEKDMQHFVYVECTFGHIYYTIPINNISQGFLVSFGQLLGSQDIQDLTHTNADRLRDWETEQLGQSTSATIFFMVFTTASSARHRFVAEGAGLGWCPPRTWQDGRMGGSDAYNLSILFTSIFQHLHKITDKKKQRGYHNIKLGMLFGRTLLLRLSFGFKLNYFLNQS